MLSILLSSRMAKLRTIIKDSLDGDERRFATAQALYIFSVSFAWYLHDVARWLLFLSALFIINKSQRRADVMKYWHGMTKVTGWCFITLGFWITVIPPIFGQESFFAALRSIERLLEVALWIWGAMVFAKNGDFFKRMLAFSTWSCVFCATVYFIQRTGQSFAVIYDDWWFGGNAVRTGIQLIFLFPWLVYSLAHTKKNNEILIFSCAVVESVVVAIFTYYSTIWVALFVQLLCIPPLMILMKIRPNTKIYKVLTMVLLCFCILFSGFFNKYPIIKDRLKIEITQFSAFGKNIEEFTNKRSLIWAETIDLAKNHPIVGYGYDEYHKYSKIDMNHPHSSYLQALFYTGNMGMILFILVLVLFSMLIMAKMIEAHDDFSMLFILPLMLVSYSTASLTEVLFYASREVAIGFWVPVSLLLSQQLCNAKDRITLLR